jgi:hypothetical protein
MKTFWQQGRFLLFFIGCSNHTLLPQFLLKGEGTSAYF